MPAAARSRPLPGLCCAMGQCASPHASFAIIAEERHEFGNDVEASARQIVIEVLPEYVGSELETLGERVVARAEQWAKTCIRERTELGELDSAL